MELQAIGVAKAVSAYGILGLGWVLFLFSMYYIRVERRRYQDLVIHIITYFTKIHMAEGRENVFPFELPGIGNKKSHSRRKHKTGPDLSDSNDEEE